METPTLRFKNDEAGDFPNWEVTKLGDIADIKLGKMLDKAKHTSGQLLPYLNNISLRWNDVDTSNLPRMYFKDNELERFGLKAGDVVVCEGGEPGRSAIWDGRLPNLKFQKAIHRVRFTVPYEAPLLVLYLERIVGTNRFEMLFTGGGIKHLTRETFASLQIPLPSLPEQRKIADFLTAVDGRIGQLIQKKALLEDYKKGVMQQLFTQAIRFKDDHGNDFPDWEEKGIGDSIDLLSGYPFPSDEILDSSSTEDRPRVLLMRGVNITGGSIRHSTDYDRFFCGNLEKLEKYQLEVGDMVIGMDGSKVGRNSAIVSDVEDGSLLVQRVARIKAKEGASLEYIYQHINSFVFHRYVDRVKTSSGIPHISAKQIREFKIGFPCFDEQTKIADFLSAIDRKIESVATQITETQSFKRGLLQQMFV